jgi:hypothetical protein
MLSPRTLSGRESGTETDIYRRCRTQTIDAGTPTYAPTISFVAISVVRISQLNGGVAKLLTNIAPDRGIHGERVHKQHKGAYEKPGAQEHRADVHAVDLPW